MQQGGDFLQDGSQIVCLDETSKNELTWARRYGRAACGERAELTDVFIRGDWYSLLAALTIDGYIVTEVVPGSYDSISFYEFIQEKLVCSFCVEHGNYQAHALFVKLPEMAPFPVECSVLVLDNCRIHHNEALVDLVRAAGDILLV
jgi:hypothetical protein